MSSPFTLQSEPPPSSSISPDADEFPRVIRRDTPQSLQQKPNIVPWLGHKIERAVAAACASVHAEESIGRQVRAEIEFRVRKERPLFVHIEQLQDMVEEILLELGHHRVALSYGKYRAKRAALRELAHQQSYTAEGEQLELATREQITDIRARVSFSLIGLKPSISESELISRLLRSTSMSLSEEERKETIILNAKSLLELDADSRFVAGRVLLTYIYEETLSWKISDGPQALKEAHKRAFLAYIPRAIALGRLSPRMAEFDLRRLGDALDPFADLQFDFLGIQTLFDRYLIHTRDAETRKKVRMEAPQIFWMRVAMGLALNESDKESRAIDFYSLYKTRRACSSTPTLFNSGTLKSQLSSCYLLYCGDSIEDITETWNRFAHLSKWAGGLGCSWTAVRGTGAHIHGTNGESSGVVPFLKVSNDIAIAVNQGGKRPGALCSYLELWHADIEDFLDLRKETGGVPTT